MVAADVNEKLAKFSERLEGAVNGWFPFKTVYLRDDDKKWMNIEIRKEVRKRKEIFKRKGKCAEWRAQKAKTDGMVRKRKEEYWRREADEMRRRILQTGGRSRNHFCRRSNARDGVLWICGMEQGKRRPPTNWWIISEGMNLRDEHTTGGKAERRKMDS